MWDNAGSVRKEPASEGSVCRWMTDGVPAEHTIVQRTIGPGTLFLKDTILRQSSLQLCKLTAYHSFHLECSLEIEG